MNEEEEEEWAHNVPCDTPAEKGPFLLVNIRRVMGNNMEGLMITSRHGNSFDINHYLWGEFSLYLAYYQYVCKSATTTRGRYNNIKAT